MESYILLDDLRFHAHHGVGPQETLVGNEFSIDLRLQTDISRALESDSVDDTVSYAAVFEAVREEMNIPSRLLEHVAGRIVQRLFRDFPTVESIDLTLCKRNPPMGADIRRAGVRLRCRRPSEE